MAIEIGTNPASEPNGDWFNTIESARNFGGPYNADRYADKDNTGDEETIEDAWHQGLNRSSGDIRLAWRKRLKTAGVTFMGLVDLPPSTDEAFWLAETADWGTIVRLYEGLGETDVGNELDGKMAGLRRRYLERLAQIESGDALIEAQEAAGITDTDATDVGSWQIVPIEDGICSTDEYAG